MFSRVSLLSALVATVATVRGSYVAEIEARQSMS